MVRHQVKTGVLQQPRDGSAERLKYDPCLQCTVFCISDVVVLANACDVEGRRRKS